MPSIFGDADGNHLSCDDALNAAILASLEDDDRDASAQAAQDARDGPVMSRLENKGNTCFVSRDDTKRHRGL